MPLSTERQEDMRVCRNQSENLVEIQDYGLLANTLHPQNRNLHVQRTFDITLYCCHHIHEESCPFTQPKYPAMSGCIRLAQAIDVNCRSRPRFSGLFPRIQLKAKSGKRNPNTPRHPAIVIAPLPFAPFDSMYRVPGYSSNICGLRQAFALSLPISRRSGR